LEFVKTRVSRRRKDVLAAAQDSDQDEEAEEMFGNDPNMNKGDGDYVK
jgi:hypothetical protein